MAEVPRNFKLLDELEDAEKGSSGGADVSLGLQSHDDIMLKHWQASIVQGPGGSPELRVWFLQLYAGDDYPQKPPTIRFLSKVNLDCVDAEGKVVASKLPYLAGWTSASCMKGALLALQQAIARGPRSQPADGATYE